MLVTSDFTKFFTWINFSTDLQDTSSNVQDFYPRDQLQFDEFSTSIKQENISSPNNSVWPQYQEEDQSWPESEFDTTPDNQTWPEDVFDQNDNADQAWPTAQDFPDTGSSSERYENHQEIINQDRYDEVFEGSFDEENNLNSPKQTFDNEKRLKIMAELISTEKDYLENLHIVKEYFIYPLKQGSMLVEDEMEIIFINWNDILLCTNRLYKSLKIRRRMTIKKDINIGDILCENVSHCKQTAVEQM